jgi:hypothetical protein
MSSVSMAQQCNDQILDIFNLNDTLILIIKELVELDSYSSAIWPKKHSFLGYTIDKGDITSEIERLIEQWNDLELEWILHARQGF